MANYLTLKLNRGVLIGLSLVYASATILGAMNTMQNADGGFLASLNLNPLIFWIILLPLIVWIRTSWGFKKISSVCVNTIMLFLVLVTQVLYYFSIWCYGGSIPGEHSGVGCLGYNYHVLSAFSTFFLSLYILMLIIFVFFGCTRQFVK